VVHFPNAAVAAVNKLIEGASMRLRGLDTSSLEWQRSNAQLEAYGRVLDVLLRLNEERQARVQTAQSFITPNCASAWLAKG
jgi:hypothetical protein